MNSFKTKSYIQVGSTRYAVHNLNALSWSKQLPYSLRILLENVLRHEDGNNITSAHILAFKEWLGKGSNPVDIEFSPARVLMQDFTGVPAIVDLAAMRDAVLNFRSSASSINPLIPVDLVIDHSVVVDHFGSDTAFKQNVGVEFERNAERYAFLKWGQKNFHNFRVVPPGTGICHQVNLEYLGKVVWASRHDAELWAYPDTIVGTDSHTTMINGLGVLGWGVGGIEAEATALGQSIPMKLPEVIGFKIVGQPKEGITATDIVLTITQMLRTKGVVEKFVEFYGDGLEHLSLADRATISNMSPEYGATCGYFPIDAETLRYLKLTNRPSSTIALVEQYAKAVGIWRDPRENIQYTDTLELNLNDVQASLAGPKRPQDRLVLSEVPEVVSNEVEQFKSVPVAPDYHLKDGSVVIAAITSCTNTSNPSVMLGAALLAKKAVEKGMKTKPWVKTSFAPGSQVVSEYIKKAGLIESLDALGFNLVGYGCTTCIGNSGPLAKPIAEAIDAEKLSVAAVLSGNRNFEGRIHPQVKLSFLASPLLVVAYALAGTTLIEFEKDPIGIDAAGNAVYLKDIWPSSAEINQLIGSVVSDDMFEEKYAAVFEGDELWRGLTVPASDAYAWQDESNYIQKPPYFDDFTLDLPLAEDIHGAKLLALLGDSITTDHISPAGAIKESSAAGKYLNELGVHVAEFNSYGARRGNHNVMVRGTFANIRLQNELTPEVQGGFTLNDKGEVVSIFDAAMQYKEAGAPLIVVAGKEYGTGSSRDWAAKGTLLLGVKAVIAESFERIHRSNLVGMGVLPLIFQSGVTRKDLNLTGGETFSLVGVADISKPNTELELQIQYENGSVKCVSLISQLNTATEVEYFKQGGIMPFVLRKAIQSL